MSAEPIFSWRNRWFSLSVGITTGLAVVSAIIGFIILPYTGPNARFVGIWDVICSAAGVPRHSSQSSPEMPKFKTSDVVFASEMQSALDPRSIGRGATLAMQCAICHASNRRSQADTPNLEGQTASVIYKELRDFKAGARVSAIMSPFAITLSERDMLDLAAYYSYLPRQPGSNPDFAEGAPLIVVHGAALRYIPPCSACHAVSDPKIGSPWLETQSAIYIKAQLQAFKAGARHNDISEQMRNIARQMTETEMDEAASYFASRP